jgi:effector-associated domain 2 (EAD2)-containing protein
MAGEPGKAALVEALLRVPVMQEPDGRALVLAELSERGYRLDAMRYSRDRHDIWAIVTACLQQPGALAALTEILRGIEGEHLAVTEFRRLAGQHMTDAQHPPGALHPPSAGDPPLTGHDREPDLLIRAMAPEFAEFASVLPHVAREHLTRGTQLGAGARGRVFSLTGRPGLVYKEYLSPQVNAGALAELILQRSMMGAADRKLLDASTSWPLIRVMDGRQIVGCLMRAIPDDFYLAASDNRRLAYLSYLCYPPRPAWSSIRMPTAPERLEIARGIVDLVALLQRHSLVIGDISAQNLLWACDPAPHVFLLGCDALRPAGAPSALPEGETPDWRDPLLDSGPPDLDSDNYKVALAVGRILSQEPYARPGEELPLLNSIPQAVASGVRERFAEAASPRGQRPAIDTWAEALRMPRAIQLQLPRDDPPGPRTVQPLYLACDVTAGTDPASVGYAPELTSALQDISWHPVASDRTRISIAVFSDQAKILLPLSDVSGDLAMPELRPDGHVRRFGPVFTLMRGVIERDLRKLRLDGYRVMRPVVIFIASGPPADDWQPSLDELCASSAGTPEIFICPVGTGNFTGMVAASGRRVRSAAGYSPGSLLLRYADVFVSSDVDRPLHHAGFRPDPGSGLTGTGPIGIAPISLEYLDPGDDDSP